MTREGLSGLTQSMEDYLEATAVLKETNGVARVKDISRKLNVKTSSVNAALNNLAKNGFIVHEKYGYVELTDEGRTLAEAIRNRHDMLVKFLSGILLIDSKIAQEDACKMEHSISSETSKRLSKFIEFIDTCCKDNDHEWLERFGTYYKTGKKHKSLRKQVNRKKT